MKGEFDFETYSEAGQIRDPVDGKLRAPKGAKLRGLSAVGTTVYAQHSSTEVLTLSFDLPAFTSPEGVYYPAGLERWRPGMPNPQRLFDFLRAGGILEAHKIFFERSIWTFVCVPKYGWPSLEPFIYQLRCSMAKARVSAAPAPLAELGAALNLNTRKDADGKRLLDKFSVPRQPTKKDARLRIRPEDEPEEGERLYRYCDIDVATEKEASVRLPEMTMAELEFWHIDQEINWRGVAIDRKGVRDCLAVLEQALERYGDECREITGGLNPTQGQAIMGWLRARGVYTDSLDEEHREELLKRMAPPPPGANRRTDPRRIVEIIDLIGSASVKKLYAMELQAGDDDRLHDLIAHHGARTGRPTGEGPQPLNLPKDGPPLKWCEACDGPFAPKHEFCPWCAADARHLKTKKWSARACDTVLQVMATRNLGVVEWYFDDAVLAIMGCVRGLFVAGPGHELIASDFSAIEAVVTAMLAKEEWRIETFRQKKDIYLMSAAKITGRSAEEYEAYKAANDDNHPDRQKVGKVAELALGFGGWIGAWRNFDDTATFTDDEVKRNIIAWRDASPNVVELWGGQARGFPWERSQTREYFGFEGAAVQALMYPGHVFEYAGVQFFTRDGHLIVRLLSGRELTYRNASLQPASRQWAAPWEVQICYWTWNTNVKYGPKGWVPMTTYGPKLTENIVQAIAHDILRFAIKNLRMAGYACVLHIYDEIVCQVPTGTGSVEELERIMATLPPWAAGWPIRADGGWRGYRYRKG